MPLVWFWRLTNLFLLCRRVVLPGGRPAAGRARPRGPPESERAAAGSAAAVVLVVG